MIYLDLRPAHRLWTCLDVPEAPTDQAKRLCASPWADAEQYTAPEHSDPDHLHEGPPRQQLVDSGRVRLVAPLLATLPSEQREVLVLRVPLRLTVEDTAKIVGTSPATVRLIQHRALNRLRQELQDGFHDSRSPI